MQNLNTSFKVIIAGSRDFNDYSLLEKEAIKLLKGYKPREVQIVCGGAYGADKLGARFGNEKGCEVKYFLPDWEGQGKKAGFLRNWEMAKYSDACIVFWDGVSKGTKHMIDLAIKEGLYLKIILYKEI